MKRFKLLQSLLLISAIGGAHADSAQQVSIPPAAFSASPGPLPGFLFSAPGQGPHPAVVMLHGCGGAYDNQGKLAARHQMWGAYFADHGYTALMLDSFTPRGVREICTVKFANRTLKEDDRAGDAYAALAWLRQQSGIDGSHISLLGWSHGAGVTLEAIGQRPKAGDGFNAAVAFYPGCTSRNKKSDQFHPYAALLLLIGESDDWTPAAPCEALADKVMARGEPMQIVLYPDTYHDFDNPGLKTKRVRSEVPNGVNPGQGVTVAPNAQAREDAMQRVITFLDAHLK